jgi:hypothetical protein
MEEHQQKEQSTGTVRPLSEEEKADIVHFDRPIFSGPTSPSAPEKAPHEPFREFNAADLEAAAIHEQLVEDAVGLLKAQNQAEGKELDDAFYEEIRGLYRKRTDEQLRRRSEQLSKEMEGSGTK